MTSRPSRQQQVHRTLGLGRPARVLLICAMTLFGVVILLPLYWVVVSATKNQTELYGSFGLWFHGPFNLFRNIHDLFTYRDDIFGRWLLNTAVYSLVGGGGATILACLGGYAFSRFEFRGKQGLFAMVLASLLVPITALTIPTYILYSKIGLVNNVFGMLIPSLVSPIGVYLMRVYIDGSVPAEVIDAARIDGASEPVIFARIAAPLMVPGAVTVLLLTVVATWNNYFLPFIIFSRQDLYPVTVGLSLWATQSVSGGSAEQLYPLVVTGAIFSILPLMILFIVLQRYWRAGLLSGATK
jgi:multiple sugar transport system permease protein